MHIAVAQEIDHLLKPNLNALSNTLQIKTQEFKDIVKIGRTHLQVVAKTQFVMWDFGRCCSWFLCTLRCVKAKSFLVLLIIRSLSCSGKS